MKKKLISLALAAVMAVTLGTPVLAANTDMPFTDVTSSHWAVQAVYYCWHNGIVEGVSETEYKPEGTLTTAQFITMMGRASHEDEIQAQTASSDNWYSGYVRYLSNNGYFDGISTEESSLNTAITRQEMALIMCSSFCRVL
ncbi:MAG: S-layer homology domain-containing protein [Oscillospiraceae bacterium]|nr:S-layer homology domain-containing protein [Oscillospiraceae bacterium]